MRLKRLTLHGFKSFADRTEFEFTGSGVTCIVGPNGCGKSNVIDAVKWVLGEQRPTSLRGREMTDVIFNGTVRRAPMGLCEGSLLFDNASGTLPIDADEVRVTRRVFRTGDTEYQVNGQSCRLKDVRDLFAGTGLGSGGYGFMEQGKIDSVLASNAVDRRKVFEEASGISRFRARKRETELKLVRVEENLTRLFDIVEEINRQIRSLKVHAGKARSYHTMSARVKELQLAWSVHRYREISREQQDLDGRLAAFEREREEAMQQREALRSDLRRTEEALEQLLTGVSEARTHYAEVTERVAASKDKVELHRRIQEDQARRLHEKVSEIQETRASLASQDEEAVVVRREHEALERDRERVSNARLAREGEVGEVRARTQQLVKEREETEKRLQVEERALAELAREEARREAAISHLTQKQEELQRRREGVERAREEQRARLEVRTGEQDVHTSTLEAHRLDLAEEERRSEELDRKFTEALDHARARDGDLDRVQARVEVLQGVLGKREGLDAGTRAILDEKAARPEFLPGFRGLLYDLFEVDLGEAKAVEAALGDMAGALVVADASEALAGLRFLHQRGLGGAMFLPLDRFDPRAREPLNGLRPTHPDLIPVLSALVGGIEVVSREDLEATLVEGAPPRPLVASTDGCVLKKGCVLSTPGGKASQGVVVLQAELKTLEKRLPGLREAKEEARAAANASRTRRDGSRARVKELSVALVQAEGEAARLDQEIVHVIRELERLGQEAARLGDQLEGIADELEKAQEELAGVAHQKSEIERRITEVEQELQARRQAQVTLAAELQRLVEDLEAARMEEVKLIERLDALVFHEKRLQHTAQEARKRLERDEREVQQLEASQAESANTVVEETALWTARSEEAKSLSSVLEEREKGADGVREVLRGHAEALHRVEEALESLSDRAGAERGRAGELRAALQGLLERSEQELELNVVEQAEVIPLPEDGDTTDWKEVEVELRSLKDKIVRLGNVNLAAVEELEAAEERATFIEREQKDLDDSREQLRKVLKSIETESTSLFLETFNAVREHFSVIFRKLFGGGKADILLEDESNPLESGIEIKARPPGKELRSITLLSGGERTMTAVALLFAIFRANPAPCALLDEVDAALDEDNTDRFCQLLDDFMSRSQFLIVTHSKRTMERADLLYGVTMPERGVSRRVAVRLEQVDEHGNIRDVRALERASAAEMSPTLPREAETLEAPPPGPLEAHALARRVRPEKSSPE